MVIPIEHKSTIKLNSNRFTTEEILSTYPKFERCLNDLRQLGREVVNNNASASINTRGIENSINSTILEVFGAGSEEYRIYQARLLPVIFTDPEQIRKSFIDRIQQTQLKLQDLINLFKTEAANRTKNNSKGSYQPPNPTPLAQSQNFIDVAEERQIHKSHIVIIAKNNKEQVDAVWVFLDKLGLKPLSVEWPQVNVPLSRSFKSLEKSNFALIFIDSTYSKHHSDNLVKDEMLFVLGYVAGYLGEEYVCALYNPNIKLPPISSLLMQICFDDRGAWQLELARKIKMVGIEFDLNKAI